MSSGTRISQEEKMTLIKEFCDNLQSTYLCLSTRPIGLPIILTRRRQPGPILPIAAVPKHDPKEIDFETYRSELNGHIEDYQVYDSGGAVYSRNRTTQGDCEELQWCAELFERYLGRCRQELNHEFDLDRDQADYKKYHAKVTFIPQTLVGLLEHALSKAMPMSINRFADAIRTFQHLFLKMEKPPGPRIGHAVMPALDLAWQTFQPVKEFVYLYTVKLEEHYCHIIKVPKSFESREAGRLRDQAGNALADMENTARTNVEKNRLWLAEHRYWRTIAHGPRSRLRSNLTELHIALVTADRDLGKANVETDVAKVERFLNIETGCAWETLCIQGTAAGFEFHRDTLSLRAEIRGLLATLDSRRNHTPGRILLEVQEAREQVSNALWKLVHFLTKYGKLASTYVDAWQPSDHDKLTNPNQSLKLLQAHAPMSSREDHCYRLRNEAEYLDQWVQRSSEDIQRTLKEPTVAYPTLVQLIGEIPHVQDLRAMPDVGRDLSSHLNQLEDLEDHEDKDRQRRLEEALSILERTNTNLPQIKHEVHKWTQAHTEHCTAWLEHNRTNRGEAQNINLSDFDDATARHKNWLSQHQDWSNGHKSNRDIIEINSLADDAGQTFVSRACENLEHFKEVAISSEENPDLSQAKFYNWRHYLEILKARITLVEPHPDQHRRKFTMNARKVVDEIMRVEVVIEETEKAAKKVKAISETPRMFWLRRRPVMVKAILELLHSFSLLKRDVFGDFVDWVDSPPRTEDEEAAWKVTQEQTAAFLRSL